jgi:hypothetical protein
MMDKFTLLALVNWKAVDAAASESHKAGRMTKAQYNHYLEAREAVHITLTKGDASVSDYQRALIDGFYHDVMNGQRFN